MNQPRYNLDESSELKSNVAALAITILAFIIAGCLPPVGGNGGAGGNSGNSNNLRPPANVSRSVATARDLPATYARGLAKSYRDTAAACESGQFKGWGDLFDFGKSANAAAREAAWREHEDALTAELLPDGKKTAWDAAKAAKVLRESADVFEAAAGGKGKSAGYAGKAKVLP